VAVLAGFHATITSASIAGLVLTIGMAVDVNVIVFERIKEELGMGKNYQNAVNIGYRRSLAPVLDSHVTTFLTAAILFYFGLGPVRGFATTQMIGIVLNLICGLMISRLITDFFTNKQKHLTYFTAISNKIFKHATFKFIEFRKIAYIISIVVLVAGLGAIWNGFDEGVEFKGGHSYSIRFDKPMNGKIQEIKTALKPKFGGEEPEVKTIGDNNRLEITTSYLVNKTGTGVELEVEKALYEGLQPFLAANTGFETFDLKNKVGSNVVKPSISDDLKSGAEKATIISMLIICLYIFLRFRDWRYALGTIISLLHDVLVTLAVFSFARKIVPFPLEIDQHFIAAILTVIGFSMNDTIIVFDRIRENSKLMPNATKSVVINKSINDTLSRTIMTSLTVFLTLLVLFIFGGETTRGFAFAMMIGVVTGTYSSIFVAAPILVDFGKDKPLGGQPHTTTVAAPKKTTV
jgi:SecD/SecF fusion protein